MSVKLDLWWGRVMNKIKNLITLAVLSIFSGNVLSYELCQRNGFVVGFFNGVANQEGGDEGALKSLYVIQNENKTKNIGGDKYGGEKVDYELFYNTTEDAFYGFLNVFYDVFEVFDQRHFELLGKHYEIISLLESGNSEIANALLGIYPESESILQDIMNEVEKEYKASIIGRVEQDLTSEDYKKHNNKMDELERNNKRIVLIAHSQGNLFLNKSYDHIVEKINKDNISALHVAPASRTIRGKHILSDNDAVISSLRYVYGDNSVPENNISIPFHMGIPFTDDWKTGDFSGHKLLSTYLNKDYNGLLEFNENMRNMFFDLKYRSKQNTNGFFNALITVKGEYDQTSSSINVIVKEPAGANPQNYGRYYSDMTGFKSSCESSEISGEYEIGYNDGGSLAGREAVLTITDSKGKEIAKRDFVIGEGLSQWWLLPKVDIGRVLVQKKNDSNEYEIIFK